MVVRILERFSQLLSEAKEILSNVGADGGKQSRQIRELAPVILDYIRMRVKEYPEQGGVVEVAELMLRLREGARVIKKTLHLLESQGCAVRTDFRDVWEITDPRSEP
jgi:hypothetical protein